MPSVNIFGRLNKWAHRQDENFVTESLAVVLEVLLDRQKDVGLRLIRGITGGFIDVDPSDLASVDIRTQVETTEGRPDLELRCRGKLSVVEVKVESEVRRDQLEGYRRWLRASGVAETQLILLTRYPFGPESGDEPADVSLRWYEVADLVDCELRAGELTDAISRHVCEQFLSFLEGRNMAIAQVNWQLKEGSKALRSFLTMLQEAAKACRLQCSRPKMSLESVGFELEKGSFWVGLQLDDPEKLWFATSVAIDVDAARQIDCSVIEPAWWDRNLLRWFRGVELESEDVHFYSRSKVAQIEWLERFLQESVALGNSIIRRDIVTTLAPDED